MDEEDHCLDVFPARPAEIDWGELPRALRSLEMFDDPFLSTQAFNIGIVDEYLTRLEFDVLEACFQDEYDKTGQFLLNAQTQMWLFAVYELLRTWRQRCRETLSAIKTGTIEERVEKLRSKFDYAHSGNLARAEQLERLKGDPSAASRLEDDLRLTYVLFYMLDFVRVTLAKHEVKQLKRGDEKLIAQSPGIGWPDKWSGSLTYELEVGHTTFERLSRRNVADGIRAWLRRDIPSPDEIQAFKSTVASVYEIPPDIFRARSK